MHEISHYNLYKEFGVNDYMPEKMILDYVGLNTLVDFGFKADSPSAFVYAHEGKEGYTVHAGFYLGAQILIGLTHGKRREWFFDTIPVMSEKERMGERYKEWKSRLQSLTTRKNRVAGKGLHSRLRSLTYHSVPSSNPCPVSGEQVL